MNKGEPVHIEQSYGETIEKNKEMTRKSHKLYKKEENFVQFNKKITKRAGFRKSIAGNVIYLHGKKRYNAYIENTTDDKRDRML